MAQLPDLSVKFTADTAGFTAATQRVANNVQNLERSVTSSFAKMRTSAASFGRNAIAGLVGGFSVGAVVAFGRAAVNMASGLNEAAQQVGLTTRELQEFQYVAEQSGVSSEALSSAFAKLNDTIGDAAQGNETANNAFAALGVAYRDAAGNVRGAGAVFEDMIRRLSQIPDAATRFSLASAVMGRGAAQLQPIIAGGTAEFERMRNEAHALGLVLSDDLANAADASADSISRSWRRLQIAITPIVTAIMEAVARMMEGIQAASRSSVTNPLGWQLDLASNSARTYTDDVTRLRREVERLDAMEGEAGFGLSQVAAQTAARQELARAQALLDRANERVAALRAQGARLPSEDTPPAPPPGPTVPPAGPTPVHRDAAAARTAESARLRALREEQEAIEKTLDKYLPLRNLELDRNSALNYLDAAQQRNTISAREYASAVSAVSEEYLQQIESATDLSGILVAELSTREHLARRLEQLQSLLENHTITQEQYAAATERARRQAMGLQEQWQIMEEAGKGFASAITDGLEAVITRSKSVKDALRGIVDEIARVALRLTILKPLEALIGAGFSAATGSIFGTGATAGGAASGAGGGIGHVPTMAQGGIVTGPTLALVGEGPYPEAVIPMPGGAIPIEGGERASNNATAIINIDARNAEAGVERRIMAVLRVYEPGLIARLMDAAKRGGAFAKAFGQA